MEYVYVYMHPEYPYLYVGRTCDLEKRIATHDTSSNDNIAKEYEGLLQEASVYYIPLQNKAESIIAETYLINKHKPFLNKMLKYEDVSTLEVKLPRYIKMDDKLRKLHIALNDYRDDVKDKEQRIKELNDIKEQLSCTEIKLQKLRDECENKQEMCRIYSYALKNTDTRNVWFTPKEVDWIMDNCGVNIAFYAGVMDINTGEIEYFKYENCGEVRKCYLRSSKGNGDWSMLYECKTDSLEKATFDIFVGNSKYTTTNTIISTIYLQTLNKELKDAKNDLKKIKPYTAKELVENNGQLPSCARMVNTTMDDKSHIEVTIRKRRIEHIGINWDYGYNKDESIEWLKQHEEFSFFDERLKDTIESQIGFLTEKIQEFEQRMIAVGG